MSYFSSIPGYTFDPGSGQYVPQGQGMQTKTSDGPGSALSRRGPQGYQTPNTASPRNGRAATPSGSALENRPNIQREIPGNPLAPRNGMQTASGGGLQAGGPKTMELGGTELDYWRNFRENGGNIYNGQQPTPPQPQTGGQIAFGGDQYDIPVGGKPGQYQPYQAGSPIPTGQPGPEANAIMGGRDPFDRAPQPFGGKAIQ